jgi:hypothetical protein
MKIVGRRGEERGTVSINPQLPGRVPPVKYHEIKLQGRVTIDKELVPQGRISRSPWRSGTKWQLNRGAAMGSEDLPLQ